MDCSKIQCLIQTWHSFIAQIYHIWTRMFYFGLNCLPNNKNKKTNSNSILTHPIDVLQTVEDVSHCHINKKYIKAAGRSRANRFYCFSTLAWFNKFLQITTTGAKLPCSPHLLLSWQIEQGEPKLLISWNASSRLKKENTFKNFSFLNYFKFWFQIPFFLIHLSKGRCFVVSPYINKLSLVQHKTSDLHELI